jgi:sortase A
MPAVKLAKVLSAIGRSMITAGVLILLFVAYQLWGTGIREAQAQDRLKRDFARQLAADDPAVTPSSSSSGGPVDTTPPSTAPEGAPPPEGNAAGEIIIPKVGLDAYVIEGVRVDDLKDGPGHYPGTPLPGQKGNSSIAGHRTTYGAPFANIDELVPGDQIQVRTSQGQFTYAVMPQTDKDGTVSGHLIVGPNAVEVLNDFGDNRLTLTACHPKYSASQRIIVVGVLQGEPKPSPPPEARPKLDLDTTVSGTPAPKRPAVLLGLLCAAIWAVAWLVGRKWRKWPSYAIGLPFFLVALFFFFENFSRLLPSNF